MQHFYVFSERVRRGVAANSLGEPSRSACTDQPVVLSEDERRGVALLAEAAAGGVLRRGWRRYSRLAPRSGIFTVDAANGASGVLTMSGDEAKNSLFSSTFHSSYPLCRCKRKINVACLCRHEAEDAWSDLFSAAHFRRGVANGC